MYEVQRDVPIAEVTHTPGERRRLKYPFEDMAVGDMFFVPNRDKNTLAAYVWSVGKELDRKFSTRMTWMTQIDGQWKPANPEDPKAVRGIGVWRVG